VTLDTTLNVLWLAIGAAALAGLGISERRHWRARAAGRASRVLAVLLITVALFPCVSLTDDDFCFSLLQSHFGRHGGVGAPLPEDSKDKTEQVHLVRMFLSLAHSQVSAAYTVSVTLCCFGFVLTFGSLTAARALLCQAGRAPPAASYAG
jgi:hypothetical protein